MQHDNDAFEERALDINEVIEHEERYRVLLTDHTITVHEPSDPAADEELISAAQVARLVIHRLDMGDTVSIGRVS